MNTQRLMSTLVTFAGFPCLLAESHAMKSLFCLSIVIFTLLTAANQVVAQGQTVAELNTSSFWVSFLEFSNAGAIDGSSGDFLIDASDFGGLETPIAQVDFSNASSVLEVELKREVGNVAGSFVVYLTDTDGIGGDGLNIAENYQYEVDLSNVPTSAFTTVSINLSNFFFHLDESNASNDPDDGENNFGLIKIGLQSNFGSTERLNISVRSVRIVDTTPTDTTGDGNTGVMSTVSQNGRLQVSGNRVNNQFGDPACLAGNSIFWSQYEGAPFYNAATVQKLSTDWNSSIVRAAMGVEESGGYAANNGQFRQRELDKVKALVEGAITHDTYVIVDFHSHAAEQYEADAIEFFGEISSLYGDHDNIIYEVYNEPINQSWATIKSYAENVIAVIRENDPDNLIVVGTPFFSQNVDVASTDPINDPNVAYTLHFYAGTHGASLRNRAITAMNNGIALFITEWGTVNASGDGAVDVESTNVWMEFCRDHEICHANWSIVDKDEGSAAIQPNRGINGLLNDQLTESGLLVRSIVSNWSTFVGKPTTNCFAPGDVNQDGSVNFRDISPFISLLSTGEYSCEADLDQSSEVDFRDISPFIGLLSGS